MNAETARGLLRAAQRYVRAKSAEARSIAFGQLYGYEEALLASGFLSWEERERLHECVSAVITVRHRLDEEEEEGSELRGLP